MSQRYDSMPTEICARMLTGHDAISSQSCLVRELLEGQKKWNTSRCEFLLSFCLESGDRGLLPGKDCAPHRS
jgi:hypothetical protein